MCELVALSHNPCTTKAGHARPGHAELTSVQPEGMDQHSMGTSVWGVVQTKRRMWWTCDLVRSSMTGSKRVMWRVESVWTSKP